MTQTRPPPPKTFSFFPFFSLSSSLIASPAVVYDLTQCSKKGQWHQRGPSSGSKGTREREREGGREREGDKKNKGRAQKAPFGKRLRFLSAALAWHKAADTRRPSVDEEEGARQTARQRARRRRKGRGGTAGAFFTHCRLFFASPLFLPLARPLPRTLPRA